MAVFIGLAELSYWERMEMASYEDDGGRGAADLGCVAEQGVASCPTLQDENKRTEKFDHYDNAPVDSAEDTPPPPPSSSNPTPARLSPSSDLCSMEPKPFPFATQSFD